MLLLLGALCALGGCDYFVSADQRVQRAQDEIAQGKYSFAEIELKRVLSKTPNHVKALATFAQLSLKKGDPETAQRQLDLAQQAGAQGSEILELQCEIWLARGRYDDLLTALKDDHVLPPARRSFWLAAAQIGKKQFDDAAQSVAAGLLAAPDNAELLLQRARLLAVQAHSDEAMEAVGNALHADPRLAAAWMLRGQLLLRKGAYEEAVVALKKGRETGLVQLNLRQYGALLETLADAQLGNRDAQGAAETIQELETRFPKAPAGRFLHARMAMLKQDYATAVNDLQQVLEMVPGFVPARLMLGAAFLYGGEPKHAQTELSGLLTKDPSNLAARKLLAQVDLALRKPDDARRLLAEAPQGSSDSQLDWLTGVAYLQGGQGKAGIDFLERSVAEEPAGVDRRMQLARAYVSSGLYEKAVALLEGLEPTARSPQSQALLVQASVAGKQPEAAKQAIANLVAKHPDDDELLATAGTYAQSLGEPTLAEGYLNRSLAANPKNIDARMGLAQLRIRESKFDAAESQFKEILQVDSKYQRAYWGLAALAARRGDSQAAQKYLEQAIAADPSAVRSRLLAAQLAFAAGDAKRGQSLIDQAVSVAKGRPVVLNAAGEVLLQGGLVDQALGRFNEAVAAGSQEAGINVALAQIALGRNEEARVTLSGLVNSPALKQRADLLLVELDLREHEVDNARRRIKKLREQGLPAFAADELEGNADMIAGQYAQANKLFSSALAQRSNSALVVKTFQARRAASVPNPQDVLSKWLETAPKDRAVRMVLADYYQRNGAKQAAIGQYERLLSDVPQPEASVLNNLAWLYIEAGDARSVDTASRAFAAAPTVANVADTYGWALVRTGKAVDGLAILNKAAALAPKDPTIQYHLAAAYVSSGDKPRAADLLATSLRSSDTFAERAEAEALLRKIQLQ